MTERRLKTASSCICIFKELAECINLEDVAKELNDHAANSVHFPLKINGPCLNERIDLIMKSCTQLHAILIGASIPVLF